MPKKLYTESYIQDIADAIRNLTGDTDKYKVSEMAPAIRQMRGGLKATNVIINTAEYTTN